MVKQFGNCWLYRDKGDGNHYCFSKARPVLQERDDRTEIIWVETTGAGDMVVVKPDAFHKLTPTRLKPGEGPMRAQITIEI